MVQISDETYKQDYYPKAALKTLARLLLRGSQSNNSVAKAFSRVQCVNALQVVLDSANEKPRGLDMNFDDIIIDAYSEQAEIRHKRRFSDPAYDNNICSSGKVSPKPPVKYKTFLYCVVDHSKCNGQISTNNFVHHCFCSCHSFGIRKELF